MGKDYNHDEATQSQIRDGRDMKVHFLKALSYAASLRRAGKLGVGLWAPDPMLFGFWLPKPLR